MQQRPKLLDVCLYLRSPLACERQKRYFVVFRSDVAPHDVVWSWLDKDEVPEKYNAKTLAERERREFKHVLDVYSDGGTEDEFEFLEKSCVLYSEDAPENFKGVLDTWVKNRNEWLCG